MDIETGINTRGELYAALAAARLEFTDLAKSKEVKTNTYSYKYADLAAIIDATAAPLAKHGLSLIQEPEVVNDGGKMLVIVYGTIVHKSGATYQLRPLPLPVQQTTPQGIGSAISYARRYQIQAALNLAADDDDGQGAKGETKETAKPAKPASEPHRQSQAQPAAHRTPPPAYRNGTEPKKEPTPEEVIESWGNSAQMFQWAIDVKGCANIHEAKNSWKNVLADHGGEVTDENRETIRRAFYDRQMEKLAEKQAAPVTA